MVIGNLDTLPMAGLPEKVRAILRLPECSLQALSARAPGKWGPEGAEWFCNIQQATTQPKEARHTEYHHLWADIQVMLEGEEIICAGIHSLAEATDEQRKPDLYIAKNTALPVSITLRKGDFAVFMPGEPHQALCAVDEPQEVRKAVFKISAQLLGN
ncbi:MULTISPECIES: YhcH/YjgK/YiaL family protein [Klebsiella]|uniref:YhcH/YjgK/YiaL family protein n=1 Tax=Klebsiella variicola TaxID=244366 RepID=A0ABD7PDD3_KLEVA|nr:YhcH/YjgK/YiaL family protein [Klebsiella variicola]MCD9672782.1 YhcH/YjgK/YiaL family protein [Klebsiella variicola subsp. variicola]MCK6050141.1 YhcH/YjgK/YiaL family protein [Klebsiella variicola]PXL43355.1 YhcH/YjgK/YiaL family protein [Klebsiella variicola]SXF98533.1 YhcH/YjgK/YiaL family protein [Klebsiella variicola]